MSRLISKIKVFVFIPTEPPREFLEKWNDSMIKAGPKIRQGIKQAISGVGDYAKKMAKPSIQNKINFLNPNYRTKRGRSFQVVIENMIAKIPDGYEKFKEKIDSAFETIDGEESKRFRENIEMKAYRAALNISRSVFPFNGYKDLIRGVAPFAVRWLSGDTDVRKLVTKTDKDIQGEPVLICPPERIGEFRKALNNRLRQAGAQIVRAGFHPEIIQTENNLTNELVNQFLSDAFAKFVTGGESHLDYVMENGLMHLDIQVSNI